MEEPKNIVSETGPFFSCTGDREFQPIKMLLYTAENHATGGAHEGSQTVHRPQQALDYPY